MIESEIRNIENQVVNLNTRDQIYTLGVGVNGFKLKPENKPYRVYSANYTKFKRGIGLYQGFVDLNLTGNFLKSFRLVYFTDSFMILANDTNKKKQSSLREKYGDFEGLTDKSKAKLIKILAPLMAVKIKEIL